MKLEEVLNIIAQLQATRTNIHKLIVQECIGYGKFRTVLEGKTFNELKSLADFNTYKDCEFIETNFLATGCYIVISNKMKKARIDQYGYIPQDGLC